MISLGSLTEDKLILAINGAEYILQVLLCSKKEILFYQRMYAPRQGMKFLPITINMAFDSIGLNPKDLAGIACVTGPGFFTGLRVVISIAVGISRAANVPMAPLNYLFLIAKTAYSLALKEAKEIWVLTYARKNMVYIQGFKVPDLKPITDPLFKNLEESFELILNQSINPILVGSGVTQFEKFWKEKDLKYLPPKYNNPSKEILWQEAISAKFDFTVLTPLYLRPSDAEANLDQIKAQRGL